MSHEDEHEDNESDGFIYGDDDRLQKYNEDWEEDVDEMNEDD